jgi:hypothetical protein
MGLIKTGVRGNSNPDMVKAISKLSQADLEAASDYLSRLPDYRTLAVPAVATAPAAATAAAK